MKKLTKSFLDLDLEGVSSGTLVKFYDVIKQEILYEWTP